ncbi:MAG: GtrA family protein [Runella slithyformis]|nr:MAG: GtrA family protein [Runella sp.]TAG18445.1 MAG: GtrA family protein [Cytophagales bacterium]TAG39740.1 MAG: GtrA family protein [Cytophagia bacterium]TAG58294.1 MAG: GtrA family protein [Runella slithyformis]TAG79279.1 MAG: GtrA family protein [Cytophagales bacterium]
MPVKNETALFNFKDLIAYFLIAGTGAAVQLVVGSFFRNYTSFFTSVTLGYIVSFGVGFVLTKLFAFDARNTNKTRREMVKFVMVAAFSFGVMMGVAFVTLSILHRISAKDMVYHIPFEFLPQKYRDINVSEASSTFAGMGFSFVSNYVLHKTFTFKNTGFYDRAKTVLNL